MKTLITVLLITAFSLNTMAGDGDKGNTGGIWGFFVEVGNWITSAYNHARWQVTGKYEHPMYHTAY